MPKSFDGDLAHYKASFLECRQGMSGHRWVWETDFKILRNRKGDIQEFSRRRRCSRCGTVVSKTYDGKTGHLLRKSSYTYPDGYTFSSQRKLDRGDAVLEALRRAIENNRTSE